MRISYDTLRILTTCGMKTALQVKEDIWTLLSYTHTPIENVIRYDIKTDMVILDTHVVGGCHEQE